MFELRRLRADDQKILAAFLERCGRDPETVRFFHPHPLTADFAQTLCERPTSMKDRFYLALYRDQAAGYFMLRGWDEGFAVPSFGGCAHPELRGAGLGHLMLAHAIAEARAAGATQVRLTVLCDNARGVHLYRKYGFVLESYGPDRFLGLLDLTRGPNIATSPPRPDILERWFESARTAA